jgi:hypothetical protein
MEPALRSGGGDIAAGPSQQPQGQRRRQQPWSQSQAQQPQHQPPHVAGMVGGQQTGQAGTGNLILFNCALCLQSFI